MVDGENGYVVGIDDAEGFVNAVEKLYKSEELRTEFRQKSLELIKTYRLKMLGMRWKKYI